MWQRQFMSHASLSAVVWEQKHAKSFASDCLGPSILGFNITPRQLENVEGKSHAKGTEKEGENDNCSSWGIVLHRAAKLRTMSVF